MVLTKVVRITAWAIVSNRYRHRVATVIDLNRLRKEITKRDLGAVNYQTFSHLDPSKTAEDMATEESVF